MSRIILILSGCCFFFGCDQSPEASHRLISNGKRTTNGLFESEIDDRVTCSIHGIRLVPVSIPLFFGDVRVYPELLTNAPHGRLARHVPAWRVPPSGRIEINRCEECARIMERYFNITRDEIEKLAAEQRARGK
jgi:hypothetical protein